MRRWAAAHTGSAALPALCPRRVVREAARRGSGPQNGAWHPATVRPGLEPLHEHVPGADQIVDAYHAQEHLFDIAGAVSDMLDQGDQSPRRTGKDDKPPKVDILGKATKYVFEEQSLSGLQDQRLPKMTQTGQGSS